MNNNILILKSFKDNLIIFFDELIGLLPTEGDIIIARLFLKDKLPILDIMNYFISKILPLKQLVQERNSSFFIDNNILFVEMNKDKVNHFKKIWRSGNLDDDDKETIFKWFDTFIILVEKYQKNLLV